MIGVLPGSDPKRAGEALIYTAHHDHLGMKVGAKPGADAIYNGALDNASGVAGVLAIARAFARLPKAPARTVYFALVGGRSRASSAPSGSRSTRPCRPAGSRRT